jgi:hypothetical protein
VRQVILVRLTGCLMYNIELRAPLSWLCARLLAKPGATLLPSQVSYNNSCLLPLKQAKALTAATLVVICSTL